LRQPRLNEEELIRLVRTKQRRAAEALYDQYSSALFLAIIRIIPEKDMAYSTLQATYVAAWNTFYTYNAHKDGPLLRWMMAIARNLANNAGK
jgi:DNA-directed RNA polymerase specialized sigma24 family protein